ncbi:DUF6199 family natural product biosynthesis protein [Brevibacillus nitrificans]|uniref:DUF6199 family natural product biosynthesis protein n=1 Tax=Brevibacillus nitrificans TaxID=651560 RepID=UPI0033B1D7D4
MFLFGVLLIVHGLLSLISPRILWFLTEGWKFKDAEPSEAAVVFGRILGVFTLLVGIYLVLPE